MNSLINFKPIKNHGQPNYGCSFDQYRNHVDMCNFINETRRFERAQYELQTQRLPYYYVDERPRLVYTAIHGRDGMKRGQNYWMNNIVNF